MKRRLLILSVALAAVGAAGSASADCDGGGVLQVNGGSATAERVTNPASPHAEWTTDPADTLTVSFVSDMAKVCGDGSYALPNPLPLGIPTVLTLDGEAGSCSIDTTADYDPFGFGAGVHDRSGKACSADVSWGLPSSPGVTTGPTPGPVPDGVIVVAGRSANAADADADGVFWGVYLHDVLYTVSDGNATLWRGVMVDGT